MAKAKSDAAKMSSIRKGNPFFKEFGLSLAALLPPPPLPERHARYALIGRTAAEWAQLEHALDRIIWDLLGVDDRTASCLTSQYPGAAQRFRAIGALILHRKLPSVLVKETMSLMGPTMGLAEDRARIVHDPWFGWKSTRNTKQFRSLTHKSSDFGLVAVTRPAIMKLIESIKKRTAEIGKLHVKIDDALGASGQRLPRIDPALLSGILLTGRNSITPGFRPRSFAASGKKGLF